MYAYPKWFKKIGRVSAIACVLLAQWGDECRKSANTGKLALFSQILTFSDPVSLQLVVSISFALFRCILKTIKNATDKSVDFLIHNRGRHFVYVLTGFPFAREC